MARISFLPLIFFCSLSVLRAETDQPVESAKTFSERVAVIRTDWSELLNAATEATPANAKTLGEDPGTSNNKPAVHVNSTGIPTSPNSRSFSKSGAASRLKAARDAVILPATPTAPRVNKVVPPAQRQPHAQDNSQELGTSAAVQQSQPSVDSSRRNAASAGQIAVGPDDNVEASSATDAATEQASKVLPSVMKRKPTSAAAPSEPTRATPAVADKPVTTSRPALPGPALVSDGPTLALPTLAEPQGDGRFDLQDEEPDPGVEPEPMPIGESVADVASLPAMPGRLRATAAPRTEVPPAAAGPFVETRPIEPETRTAPSMTSTFEPADRMAPRSGSEPMQLGGPRLRTQAAASEAPVTPQVEQPTDEDGKVLLSNRSPVLVVKTHGSRTIRVGRVATYYVSASNVGDLAAEDVVVEVSIPKWAEVTENQASSGLVRVQPNQDGDTVVHWLIRQLGAESRQRLRLDLVPRSSRPVELGVSWTFKSVSALAQIQVQEPKLQMSVVGPQEIQFGETNIYTITVSNPGSGDAENVVLTLLPITDGAGVAGTRNLGTIAPGTRRTIEVELTARQAGELAVRAHAIGDGGLQSQAAQDVRVRRAKLEIEAVGPARKYAGTDARYSIKIINTGDATAQDVVAVASLPLAAKYISSTGGGSFDAERGKVRWSVGNLRPGAFQIVELSALLMGAGSNRLEVGSSSADQLSAMADVTTEVESLADLKLTVNDPRGAVAVGTEMMYEVRIMNRGTRAAQNVNVVGYFSEGIEPVAVHGWRADVEVGQVVFEQIPRIAPGQEIVVQIAAAANRAGDHVFRTELESNDPETKLAVEEWTRFYGDDAEPSLGKPVQQQATKPQPLPAAGLNR